VNSWPAQQLLDYGNAVLGSLRPGMVYVGGTDSGCFIPTFLNETSHGEHHIVLTQNALADGSYIDYLSFLYPGQLSPITPEDSQQAFEKYFADARNRLEHDQQFLDEPKQLRPGEDVSLADNRLQVSGQVAVMSINELLLQKLMQNNPDLSFALQESFPFRSTYADAAPLGPIMELGAPNGQNAFTAETASQTVDSLRATAEEVLADPEACASGSALQSYSKDAVSQANLLASHNYNDQAEQACRVAIDLWPENPEATFALRNLLNTTGRATEAQALIQDFTTKYSDPHLGAQH